jgi:hypothetical protein
MTLAELRTALDGAKTGTVVETVFFDYNTILNETITKTYPVVVWDIDNMKGVKPIRTIQKEETIEINCWCINEYTPDADKIAAWDVLIAAMDAYLLSVNSSAKVSVKIEDVSWELFPEAFSSVDRELAVLYKIELTLWC